MNLTRRSLLAMVAAAAAAPAQSRPFTFGFSLYGMKALPWREGLGHVARIGYDSSELIVSRGWDTESRLVSRETMGEIRQRAADLGLRLPSVMEFLPIGQPGERDSNLERIRRAAEICYEASPNPPALIETNTGGKFGTWDDVKDAMADELAVWTRLADELEVTIALKAHSMLAMNLPERAIWLIDQVKHPRIQLVYDYSHFMPYGLGMRETMEQMIPRTAFIHIKDTIGKSPDHRFVLPGDGGVDYREFRKNLTDLGYTGDVSVEVSAHVFNQPGYDPVAAAEHVWEKVSPAFA